MFSLTALQTRPDLPVAWPAPRFALRTSGAKLPSTPYSLPLAYAFSPNSCSARAFLRNPLVVVRKSALIKPRFCHTPKFCSRGCSLLAPYCTLFAARRSPRFHRTALALFLENRDACFGCLELAYRARGSVSSLHATFPFIYLLYFLFVLLRRVRRFRR